MGLLQDKNVVITGAGRGLGRAYALDAARAGAAVVVNDVNAEEAAAVAEEITRFGGRAVAQPGSVADFTQAGALIQRCIDEFGRLDALVNNAGISVVGDPWEETEERARTIVEINLLGTIFCGIHALRAMVGQAAGVILNVTSGAALGILEHSLYGATKGAVVSLTYGWAMDAGAHGVRVTALSPLARTKMSEVWVNRDEAHMEEPPPESVAPLVVFLLSDYARDLNGQVVRLDAQGLSIMQPPRFLQARPLARRTIEEITSAFDDGLRGDIAPVGLTPVDLRS